MSDLTNVPTETFDVVVLGSGEAGKYLSWTLGAEGKRVALVERQYVGGSCPNVACLPSKNIIHSAKVAWYALHSEEFGLSKPAAGVDMKVVRGRKRAMVDDLIKVHERRFALAKVEFIFGQGQFIGPRLIQIALTDGGVRRITGDTVIVSAGSRAIVPDLPGLRAAQPMTHVEELELDTVPEHLIVLGAGYVGLEFAQAMVRFGSRVTVIDQGERLLSREDEDVTAALTEVLSTEGIEFLFSHQIISVSGRSGDDVAVTLGNKAGSKLVKASHILAAAGRAPNTGDIGLELAGVELDPTGHIKVDGHLRTTADGVFAVGDCAGSPHFTHIAYDDYRVVHAVLKGETRTTKGRQVPYVLYTDPELAHVGLHEHEASNAGLPFRVAKLPMAAVLRARTIGETEGFIKALIGSDDRILGFTALGTGAGELLAPVQIVMSAGLSYHALRDLVISHPTMAEGLVYLFSSL